MSKKPEDLIRESQERMRIVANCSVCNKGIRAWEYDGKDICRDCWLNEFKASTKLIVDSIVDPPNANASSITSSGRDIEKYCYACGNGIERFEIKEDYAKSGRCFFCNQKVMQEFSSLLQEVIKFENFLNGKFPSIEELRRLITYIENNSIDLEIGLKEIRESLLDNIIRHTRIDQIPDEVVAHVKGMAEQLNLPSKFILGIGEDVEYLNQIFNVKKGNLPVEEYISITLPAGEILHYETSATYEETGTSLKGHEGTMYITDRRVIFQSLKKKFEFPYHKVINVYVSRHDVTINLNRKAGSGSYTTSHNYLVGEMIEWLVKTASRQVITTQSGATRFIPQEVKIEVWQRDQGRCVQCDAQEYLEFDHIIPFSLGGATSANNLQLLCRKCNLSKGGRL